MSGPPKQPEPGVRELRAAVDPLLKAAAKAQAEVAFASTPADFTGGVRERLAAVRVALDSAEAMLRQGAAR